jgi:FtsH-binding integral membrane protein
MATDAIAPATDDTTYFRQVFAWMAGGLAVTGAVSAFIGHNQTAVHDLFETTGGTWVIIILFVIELALVLGLVTIVQHLSVFAAATTFLAYAGLNGITLSVIFAVYTTKSIFGTFFITAGMFAALAVWGYTTRRDLTSWGNYLFMALFGLILGVIVNSFWTNSTLYWVTTGAGVLIFSGLTAYDVQRLKRFEAPPGSDEAVVEKAAVVGALSLYLDFVNLFLYLLRIFGRRN